MDTNTENLEEMVDIINLSEKNEQFLKELVRGRYTNLNNYLLGGLRFCVARRWNSWYPSYFDVQGGCYAIVPGDMDLSDPINKVDNRVGVTVIDPGFKFIDILRANYQIEPQDVRNVLVTHFHPDHMAGLLEYATIMNTSKLPCNIYLNETMFSTFQSLQNAFITVAELRDGQIQELMRYRTKDCMNVQLTVKVVGVHHNELGNQHRSLGLIIDTRLTEQKANKTELISKYRIGIMGDTDGNAEYIPQYVNNFKDSDILVLHIGTFSNKKVGRGGKHLYIDGIRKTLGGIGDALRSGGNIENAQLRGTKKIIVLSEFGLELSDDETLYHKLWPFIQSHSWRLPLLFASIYKEYNDVPEKYSDQPDIRKYFAKACLDYMSQMYCPYASHENPRIKKVSRKDVEEFVLAFSLLVLFYDSDGLVSSLRNINEHIYEKLSKERSREYVDGINRGNYYSFISKLIMDDISIMPLNYFFTDLVNEAHFGKDPSSIPDLIKSCDAVFDTACFNYENIGSALNFSDKLDYVTQYAKSKNIIKGKMLEGLEFLWDSRNKVEDLSIKLVWTASMLGALLLGNALKSYTFLEQNQMKNPLLRIGEYFKKDYSLWANLMIGDIGCTFGLDPFNSPDDGERMKGIKIKSKNSKWISPYNAICSYNQDNEEIEYLEPD